VKQEGSKSQIRKIRSANLQNMFEAGRGPTFRFLVQENCVPEALGLGEKMTVVLLSPLGCFEMLVKLPKEIKFVHICNFLLIA
jgi:hypothetical protein